MIAFRIFMTLLAVGLLGALWTPGIKISLMFIAFACLMFIGAVVSFVIETRDPPAPPPRRRPF